MYHAPPRQPNPYRRRERRLAIAITIITLILIVLFVCGLASMFTVPSPDSPMTLTALPTATP